MESVNKAFYERADYENKLEEKLADTLEEAAVPIKPGDTVDETEEVVVSESR